MNDDDEDYLFMDITDEDFVTNLGWVDFVRWDHVENEQRELYGDWVNDEFDENLFYADRIGIKISWDDTIYPWCSVIGGTSGGISVFSIDDTEYLFTRNMDSGENDIVFDDDGVQYEAWFKDEQTRAELFAGTWGSFAFFCMDDSSDCVDDYLSLEIYDTFVFDSYSIAWDDVIFTNYYFELQVDQEVSGDITLIVEGDILWAYFHDADEELEAIIGYGRAPEGWSCASENMGCEEGWTVVEEEMLSNGQYGVIREFDSDLITVRRRSDTDTSKWSTIHGLVVGGDSSSVFDIDESAVDEYGIEVNLCGVNACFKDESIIRWIFIKEDTCFLKLKPLRAVMQSAAFTYDGTEEEFTEEIVP